MTTLFTACALIGGTLLVCQTLMTILGMGGDHDFHGDSSSVDMDHDVAGHDAVDAHGEHAHGSHNSTWFFGIVTLRTAVAAITFFGLAGMSAHSNQMADAPSTVIGLLAGFAAMYLVHWMMKQLRRLRADGTVCVDRAIGKTGNVYLRVPGGRQGTGKIHLDLQNRTVELTAWTEQGELPTGATIVVTKVVGPDSVEVASATI